MTMSDRCCQPSAPSRQPGVDQIAHQRLLEAVQTEEAPVRWQRSMAEGPQDVGVDDADIDDCPEEPLRQPLARPADVAVPPRLVRPVDDARRAFVRSEARRRPPTLPSAGVVRDDHVDIVFIAPLDDRHVAVARPTDRLAGRQLHAGHPPREVLPTGARPTAEVRVGPQKRFREAHRRERAVRVDVMTTPQVAAHQPHRDLVADVGAAIVFPVVAHVEGDAEPGDGVAKSLQLDAAAPRRPQHRLVDRQVPRRPEATGEVHAAQRDERTDLREPVAGGVLADRHRAAQVSIQLLVPGARHHVADEGVAQQWLPRPVVLVLRQRL